MEVTAKHLHERYSSMDTEELADSYHAGELTDLAVSVLKEVITSRGLDWAQFTKLPTTERESEPRSDWELWKQASGQGITDETRDKSQHEAIGQDESPATFRQNSSSWHHTGQSSRTTWSAPTQHMSYSMLRARCLLYAKRRANDRNYCSSELF